MFSVTLRFAVGLALGATAAWWLASRRDADMPRPDAGGDRTTGDRPARTMPQRVSDDRPAADGRVEDGAWIDGAVEDTFPASDPPAFMQAVVAGTPPRDEAETITRRQRHKRADEDAFAD